MSQEDISSKRKRYRQELKYDKQIDNLINHYDKWAADFDEIYGYIGWMDLNKKCTFEKYLEGKDLAILDVACGTGVTSQYLRSLGYTNIDGVDWSINMVNKAKENNVYENVKQGRITKTESLDCPSNGYDGIICMGGIARNEILTEYSLPDFIRISKPGGIVVYTINPEEGVSFMKENGELMQDKRIKLLSLESFNYSDELRELCTEYYVCVIKVL